MWVDEETYNNMMLGTLAGMLIGLVFAAVFGIFRLTFGANRWFYNFLKDKGLKGWQSFLICAGVTAFGFVFFCSPIILSGIKTFAQSKPSQQIQSAKKEKTNKKPERKSFLGKSDSY